MANIKINPAILRWAVDAAGISQEVLAKKTNIKPEKLLSLESGESMPSASQVRKLAEVLKRPPAIFFLQSPPVTEILPMDFRGRTRNEKITTQANFNIRQARNRRIYAVELIETLDQAPNMKFPRLTIENNSEKIITEIHEWLSFDIKKQKQLKKIEELLKYCISLVESKDILVMQFEKVDPVEFRGFSIAEQPYPVIGINSQDTYSGKIFTLFHELGHILLGRSGICDFENDTEKPDERDITEIWCNAFSAAMLCPENYFKSEINRETKEANKITLQIIDNLAKTFLVSREVIARRLFTFHYINRASYLEYREKFFGDWAAFKIQKKSKKGFAEYKYKVLNQNGRHYAEIVIHAWHNRKINVLEASDLLGVKTKHLNDIANELQRGSRR